MSYLRVIPRDLFNEGNLLKCYGQIYLELERGNYPAATLEHDDEGDSYAPFEVWQDRNDGSIFLGNVSLVVRDRKCSLRRPLNARGAYPLWMSTDEDDICVFTEEGRFTEEMKAFLHSGVEG